jgi:hypothetical protein
MEPDEEFYDPPSEMDNRSDGDYDEVGSDIDDKSDMIPRRSERLQSRSMSRLSTFLISKVNVHVPASYKEAMRSPQRSEWQAAIDREIKSLQDNGTFEIRNHNINKKKISTKWVFDPKFDETGQIQSSIGLLTTKTFLHLL